MSTNQSNLAHRKNNNGRAKQLEIAHVVIATNNGTALTFYKSTEVQNSRSTTITKAHHQSHHSTTYTAAAPTESCSKQMRYGMKMTEYTINRATKTSQHILAARVG
jgi:hypothetical protein